MNVLLIHNYIASSTPDLYLNEPIGILALATYVARHPLGVHYNVGVLDLYALGHDRVIRDGALFNIGLSEEQEIVARVAPHQPAVIGVSCNFTTYVTSVLRTVTILKRHFPQAVVVVGGAHATMDAPGILAHSPTDVVVRGEGEATFLELLEALRVGQPLDEVAGLTFRRDGEIVATPDRPLMKGIEDLPIPDRRYIDQDLYSRINKRMYFLSRGRKVASVFTSRGCPFECTFCSTKVVWERRFRPWSEEKVLEELDLLVREYGVEEIIINDDQFFTNKKRVHAILDGILARPWKIYINIASGTSVWLVDREILAKLRQAGMYRVTFPIETGSANTRDYIKKKIDFERTRELVEQANQLGMWTYANFIVGFPYETREEILQTIEYATSLGLDNATFFVAKPYAGSEMYQDFMREGLLDAIDPSHMGEASHDTKTLTRGELQTLIAEANRRNVRAVLSNYLSPAFFVRCFWPKIRTLDGFLYFLTYPLRTAWRVLVVPRRIKILEPS